MRVAVLRQSRSCAQRLPIIRVGEGPRTNNLLIEALAFQRGIYIRNLSAPVRVSASNLIMALAFHWRIYIHHLAAPARVSVKNPLSQAQQEIKTVRSSLLVKEVY